MTKSIVLIHGAWRAPTSLSTLRRYYETSGFTVRVRAWLLMDRRPAELRQNPHQQLGQLSLAKDRRSLLSAY